MSLVDAIGVASAGLTLIGFLQANFAARHDEGATVSIKAGLPELDKEGDSLGGSINKIYAFDTRNGYSGQSGGCQIDSGGICTKTVDQSVGGRQAGYISVSNNNDATCIAWITVVQFDNTPPGAWTGDIGWKCGQRWYNSVESAGRLKDEDKEYIPKCTWIDADHSNDIVNAALKFDVKAYGENVLDTVNGDACAPTLFGPDSGPIADQPGKRDTDDRPLWMTERLIMSNFTSQPAEELCSSATSWGPDFIGSDGKFCDMSSKTLIPLCSSEAIDGCIEVDENEGALVKRMSVARRSANILHKSYKSISKWGQ
ncbi:hypothetical protein CFE70_007679 [Pyrenophora teres f. teres 0-1]|uniref:Uncharacterized protein n=2 Tax=Pyrenophora teres f. teres TaxID=97479 RepID=E3RDB4_PYRTT|nr:hypothetical protein PTT_01940 [Pyrenophora teres f. teres 0-1]KAE8825340.1 hypothetical protein HRS9139_08450 [Pyrenophora teres f. teres]KAE8834436.1 hypothetical protein PTNB85_05769 [Pyrenophora teres f. teres]KAE8858860.1 hypothetical protein PTNB73_08340 [Pyrenophora teres f. teres]KAE8860723.1 hypothetical protein PTNB29_05818 [Pyrenophora teres f. teres]